MSASPRNSDRPFKRCLPRHSPARSTVSRVVTISGPLYAPQRLVPRPRDAPLCARALSVQRQLVHESLACDSAQVIPLTGDLLHLTCRDFASFQRKQLNYATARAQERHTRGKKATLTGIFTHTLGAFLKTLLLRGGVLDGKQGWLLAVVNAQYTFNKYTELWALNRGYSEKT